MTIFALVCGLGYMAIVFWLIGHDRYWPWNEAVMIALGEACAVLALAYGLGWL